MRKRISQLLPSAKKDGQTDGQARVMCWTCMHQIPQLDRTRWGCASGFLPPAGTQRAGAIALTASLSALQLGTSSCPSSRRNLENKSHARVCSFSDLGRGADTPASSSDGLLLPLALVPAAFLVGER